MLELAFAAGAV
ncbi:hypothetical protein YPPY100_2109, partial [Yersinia pestis PY-100]